MKYNAYLNYIHVAVYNSPCIEVTEFFNPVDMLQIEFPETARTFLSGINISPKWVVIWKEGLSGITGITFVKYQNNLNYFLQFFGM